jgi:hypothetical protein
MIYPQGDVAALTNALGELCILPERAVSWAEQARVMGRQRVWSETAGRFIELFHQACGDKAQ